MNIRYRPFKKSDSKTVTELIQSLYREDPPDKSALLKNIQKTFRTLLKHPDKGFILVLEREGEIIGYSILIYFWSNEFGGNILCIDELYLKKEFRGQGIGSDFISHLAAKKFGHSVALQIGATAGNKRARKLYEKLGFRLSKTSILVRELR